MAHTEILLLKPVEGLGNEGDQVKVRAGYARNFLLPRKFAAPVNEANRKQIDALKQRRATRENEELNNAQELARKLEKAGIAFAVKTGELHSQLKLAKVVKCSVLLQQQTYTISSLQLALLSTVRRFTYSHL